MTKNTNEYIAAYKVQLQQGDLQIAYERLVKYVMALRSRFAASTSYSVGNVSPGYMDFTYFPFFDDFLRVRKLRFGVVLNHREMRFELWLMGQNGDVQIRYWNLLKDTKWNKGLVKMPRYSVLEAVLVCDPDFDDLDALTAKIEETAVALAGEILSHIK